MRRIGLLVGLAENDPEMKQRLAGFREGLEKLGWSEGGNVTIDYRFAPAGTQAHLLARELVALQPDVILAQSTPATAALKPETSTIPIVFAGVADAIGSGFVASLSRPGGNLTGLLQYEEGITGKWLAMLKEIAPNLTRAGLLANPKTAAFDYFLRSAKTRAPSLAIEVVPIAIENAFDIERSIEGFAREPNGGLGLGFGFMPESCVPSSSSAKAWQPRRNPKPAPEGDHWSSMRALDASMPEASPSMKRSACASFAGKRAVGLRSSSASSRTAAAANRPATANLSASTSARSSAVPPSAKSDASAVLSTSFAAGPSSARASVRLEKPFRTWPATEVLIGSERSPEVCRRRRSMGGKAERRVLEARDRLCRAR